MKLSILAIAGMLSVNTFAGSYDCKITVTRGDEIVGTMNIQQMQTGASVSNVLYSLPISKKKNIFGKTVREVAVVLSGIIQAGSTESQCFFNGKLQQEVTTIRRTVKTVRQLVAEVHGVGAFNILGDGAGYDAKGSCSLNP